MEIMSGLDVAVNVATIVSRVQGSKGNQLNDQIRPRMQKFAESRLMRVLREGPEKINAEYNNGACRIGPSYSRGDCITRLKILCDQYRPRNLLSGIDR